MIQLFLLSWAVSFGVVVLLLNPLTKMNTNNTIITSLPIAVFILVGAYQVFDITAI